MLILELFKEILLEIITENNNTDLTHIDNTIAADFSLNYNGNYNTLINTNNFSFSWSNIFNSFINLSNLSERNQNCMNELKEFLARVIVTIPEAIRFRSIFNLISNDIQTYSGQLSWNNDISNIVTNWQSRSNQIIREINNLESNTQNLVDNFINNIGGRNGLLSNLPIDWLPEIFELRSTIYNSIRVILGLILQPNLNCNKRRQRNINYNIKNEYCDEIRDQNEGYNLGDRNITVVKILDENTKGGTLQVGDIYIGTTSGVYLWFKRGDEINLKKFDGLDYKINDIILDGNGSANVKANGLIYHLNLYGWDHTIVHDEL